MTLLIISDNPLLVDVVEAEIANHLSSVIRIIGKCFSVQKGILATQVLLPDVVLIDGDMENYSIMSVDKLKRLSSLVVILLIIESIPYQADFKNARFLQKPFSIVAFANMIAKT